MSISFMAEAVKISDKFLDRKDPDSIDRKGQLNQVVVLVVIFHAIMGIAFVKMEEYERKHPRIIRDTDVQFEIAAPPPAPEFRVGSVPRAITLTEGENPDAGSASSAKPKESDKVTLPTIKADETQPVPTPEAATPVMSRDTTVAPPVAVTTASSVKALPTSVPKTAPKTRPVTDLAGARSNSVASGAPSEGGSPDGQEGGTGEGGDGSGGSGSGDGDAGNGTGFGNIGGDITTKLGGSSRATGNIAPYRKEMLMRIVGNWHPKKSTSLILRIEIAKDGSVNNVEVKESSGSKRGDAEAVAAVEATEFPPLPDWYRGESLTFEIDLKKEATR